LLKSSLAHLQSELEQDLSKWSTCTVYSFESEQEPSGARVSPAVHVLSTS